MCSSSASVWRPSTNRRREALRQSLFCRTTLRTKHGLPLEAKGLLTRALEIQTSLFGLDDERVKMLLERLNAIDASKI